MLEWRVFSKRRNIQLTNFLRNRGINDYDQLRSLLNSMNVQPPLPAEYEIANKVMLENLKAEVAAQQPEPVKKTVPTPRKKRTRKSKASS